jgi:hypothetical protein
MKNEKTKGKLLKVKFGHSKTLSKNKFEETTD